ncbi:MAG: DUF4179 domain-containing protein [Bacteroides sp.]|nr:DUF4179 domain-containing protein [Bacteroides sp.]MCM1550731.1 DUF4179 domain-containing protein [Clostridium sp.]
MNYDLEQIMREVYGKEKKPGDDLNKAVLDKMKQYNSEGKKQKTAYRIRWMAGAMACILLVLLCVGKTPVNAALRKINNAFWSWYEQQYHYDSPSFEEGIIGEQTQEDYTFILDQIIYSDYEIYMIYSIHGENIVEKFRQGYILNVNVYMNGIRDAKIWKDDSGQLFQQSMGNFGIRSEGEEWGTDNPDVIQGCWIWEGENFQLTNQEVSVEFNIYETDREHMVTASIYAELKEDYRYDAKISEQNVLYQDGNGEFRIVQAVNTYSGIILLGKRLNGTTELFQEVILEVVDSDGEKLTMYASYPVDEKGEFCIYYRRNGNADDYYTLILQSVSTGEELCRYPIVFE